MKSYLGSRLIFFAFCCKLAQCYSPHQNFSKNICPNTPASNMSLLQMFQNRIQNENCSQTSASTEELQAYFRYRRHYEVQLEKSNLISFHEMCQNATRFEANDSNAGRSNDVWCEVFTYYEKNNSFTASLNLPVQLLLVSIDDFDIFQFISLTNGKYSLWTSFLNKM